MERITKMNHFLKGIALIGAVFGITLFISLGEGMDKYAEHIDYFMAWSFGLISARYFIWYEHFDD